MRARLSRLVIAASAALVIASSVAAPAVLAAPAPKRPVRTVAIIAPRWLYLDAGLSAGVRVATRGSSGTVAAELDLLDEAGTSIWHDVQSRRDLGSVTYEYSFSKALRDLDVGPGVFTLRARVTNAGSATVERTSQLILVDRAMRPLPVCVVVRIVDRPAVGRGSAGIAGRDATATTMADAADLGRLAELRPDLHLTIAVAPFLLREWLSAELGAEPTSTVAAGSGALESLRRAVATGTPLLHGMYAEPDLSALATNTAALTMQATRGDAARAEALPSQIGTKSVAATGFPALSGPLPMDVAALLAGRGIGYAITDTSSVVPERGSAASGAFSVVIPAHDRSKPSTMTVLTVDRTVSAALGDPSASGGLVSDLFVRAGRQGARVVVVVATVGAEGSRTAALAGALETLADIPWVKFVDAPTAAAFRDLPSASMIRDPKDPAPAPAGYWAQVADARERVAGLVAAAGEADPESARALEALLLAESRSWAGPDGSWSGAAQGSRLAESAFEIADSVLGKVTLDAPSVTLPGSEGKAPVSIMNETGRALTVGLEASSSDVKVLRSRITVRLKPGENVMAVPVSLGTASSGRLRFAVTAGSLRIAAATATVTASYQDRIVLLGTVILILVGLLFYIRRHIVRAHLGRDGLEEPDADPRD